MTAVVGLAVAALAPSLGEAVTDLALAILVAAAGTVILTISIGLAMRGGAGFVDLDREGRFTIAILALALAGVFSLVALGVTIAFVLFLIRG